MLQKLREKLYTWLTYEPPPKDILPFDFTRLRQEIQLGDVLLIEGRSRVSKIIRTITQSPWTHAGLYIGRLIDIQDEGLKALILKYSGPEVTEKTRLIVEDVLDKGAIVTPLKFYRHHHIRICRPIGITQIDTAAVVHYMILALGQPYNVRQFLDLARFLLPWSILPRRWGSSLFKTPDGKQEPGVCSSLIAEAFASVQFPVLPYIKYDGDTGFEMFQRNPHLFAQKDFDYSPYFDIIKYPLLHPEEQLPYYRKLPWTKTNDLYQDHGILSGHKIIKHSIKKDPDKMPWS